ncbi:MAG: nucleoside hydrolase [Chloroflexi bacterium]|nr:nucleoside hydrolase [Chloroflexota bacterium]
MDIPFPPEHRARVIVNTDAKNEADDQFAIVQALLTPSFEIPGIIPAHFGTRRTNESLRQSHDEVMLLLDLMAEMGWQGDVAVADGAPHAMPDEHTAVPSPGSELIVREALKDDPRPLYVLFYGPLTDMASALLQEPRIQDCDVKVVWIGGGAWPVGGQEFNLSNDIPSANVVMRSSLELWQIPKPVYRQMGVTYAELLERVYPYGPLGRYLVTQLVELNARRVNGPMEYRSLGDSPAVGVVMNPECGHWEWRPAPEFDELMHYVHTGQNRPIRVYDWVDPRFIHEDFFAKLARLARGEPVPEEIRQAAQAHDER